MGIQVDVALIPGLRKAKLLFLKKKKKVEELTEYYSISSFPLFIKKDYTRFFFLLGVIVL